MTLEQALLINAASWGSEAEKTVMLEARDIVHHASRLALLREVRRAGGVIDKEIAEHEEALTSLLRQEGR